MSSYLSQNLKFLRKQKNFTQEDLARALGLNRPSIGAYEEGRAEPKLETMQNMADYFGITIDELINTNLALKGLKQVDTKGKTLRILPVTVDTEGNERITVVPIKAAAGYLAGYRDVEFIGGLPSFNLPIQELGRERTYRLFQIKGDSMLPIPSGAYIITEYVEDWNSVKDNQCYVVISKDDGIVYKRLLNKLEDQELIMKSDNPEYKAYAVDIAQVSEIWKALGYISLKLPDGSGDSLAAAQLMGAISRIQQEVGEISKKLKS